MVAHKLSRVDLADNLAARGFCYLAILRTYAGDGGERRGAALSREIAGGRGELTVREFAVEQNSSAANR